MRGGAVNSGYSHGVSAALAAADLIDEEEEDEDLDDAEDAALADTPAVAAELPLAKSRPYWLA